MAEELEFETYKPALTEEEMIELIRGEINYHKSNTGNQNTRGTNKYVLFIRNIYISRLLGRGLGTPEVAKSLMDTFNITVYSAYKYIKTAKEFLQEQYKDETPFLKEVLYSKIESLIADSISNKDRKTALKGYELLGKITGVYEDNINLKNNMEITFKFGDED